jgi:hypothetical protein
MLTSTLELGFPLIAKSRQVAFYRELKQRRFFFGLLVAFFCDTAGLALSSFITRGSVRMSVSITGGLGRDVLVFEERPAPFDHLNRLLSFGHTWFVGCY